VLAGECWCLGCFWVFGAVCVWLMLFGRCVCRVMSGVMRFCGLGFTDQRLGVCRVNLVILVVDIVFL
jgi:hypothetical protein